MVINAGLSAGDRVVTDGIDRLTEGAKVEVVEAHDAATAARAGKSHQPRIR
ncbi:RND efflux membrane fusion protein [Klebsiella oxytoca]|nr:RND efflux membrane fusion protein [Klebsiella oxytoca]